MWYLGRQGESKAINREGGIGRICYATSTDFETWSPCVAMGLNRSPTHAEPQWEGQRNLWEEIHLGAGLWDRGNVVLAIYGMWHGHPTGDRRHVAIDLGFAISHDGLHYHEPIPSFAMLPAAEEWDHPTGWAPALQQGQAFANLGDKTCHWYSCWRHVGQVRLATWDRDRLGYVEMFRPRARAECVTCPIQSDDKAKLFVNVEMLGQEASLEIDLLDEGFHPLPAYSGEHCAKVNESGLRVAAMWRHGPALPTPGPFRLRFRFAGTRPEDIRLYAYYVADVAVG